MNLFQSGLRETMVGSHSSHIIQLETLSKSILHVATLQMQNPSWIWKLCKKLQEKTPSSNEDPNKEEQWQVVKKKMGLTI